MPPVRTPEDYYRRFDQFVSSFALDNDLARCEREIEAVCHRARKLGLAEKAECIETAIAALQDAREAK